MDNRSYQTTIGAIERVPLREVWLHEALDFTAWLQENVDVLNDVLDFPLWSAEREQAAGNPVVIENQLEKSDHDHLGNGRRFRTG